MTRHSTLDPDDPADDAPAAPVKGHDTGSLGPSDSSDSGSDLARPGTDRRLGDIGLDADSDRGGTGERMSADLEPEREVADLETDRVVDASEAGLGGGLDQAEEAQVGKTRYGRERGDKPR
jgi:hypothetical protein